MARFLATQVSRGMSIPQGGAVREDNQDVKVPVGPRQVGCNSPARAQANRTYRPTVVKLATQTVRTREVHVGFREVDET